MKTITELLAGQTLVHEGDLTIEGNVGNGAKLKITNGSLTIRGTVEERARITLKISERLRDKKLQLMTSKTQTTSSSSNSYVNSLNFYGNKVSTSIASPGAIIEGKITNANKCLFKVGNRMMGDVEIDSRIYTEHQVEEKGNGVYVITAIDPSWASRGYDAKTITAIIDGREYSAKQIINVSGTDVLVDGKPTDKTQDVESYKVTIHGNIEDNVRIESDFDIEAQTVANDCELISKYSCIKVNCAVGNSYLSAKGKVSANGVSRNAELVSDEDVVEAKYDQINDETQESTSPLTI